MIDCSPSSDEKMTKHQFFREPQVLLYYTLFFYESFYKLGTHQEILQVNVRMHLHDFKEIN